MQHFRHSKRGFTLVEVIVVLVILAILAAIMIPAMTGWIDKAKEKRLVVECRTCVNAAQTLVAETYGETAQATVPGEGDVTQLAGVPGSVSGITLADTAIATLTYTDMASSDFVSYTLLPAPKYEFGTGLTVSQAASKIDLSGLDPKTPFRKPVYSTLLDVYDVTKEKMWEGYADFINGLPAAVKASLSGKTWGLNRQNGYLYVCDSVVTLADQKAEKKVDVSVYDTADGSLVKVNKNQYLNTTTVDGVQYVTIPMN